MLTQRDREKSYKIIERIRLTRVENVRKLKAGFGSWAELSRQSGVAEAFLVQIAGPNPRRNIGEGLARTLETSLRLKVGSLDHRA